MTDLWDETHNCTNCGEYAGTPIHDHIAALQARIAELEAERDEAQEELIAAQGQIADAQAAEARLDY